jgi:hypothetical protein
VSTWLVDRLSSSLAVRTSRRGFLARSTIAATALAAAPAEYILRPVSAYAAVCRCASGACSCGDLCCDGYTEFCCTINHGANSCPSGTFAGGWWKADGSAFCSGPRYYIDCMAECSCGCGGGTYEHFCPPGCDGLSCGCADGDCGLRAAGCVTFRYGQCHTEIACTGRIACRVVTCTPAYLVDNSCGTNSFTDEATADQNQPCLQSPPAVVREFGLATAPLGRSGYWMCGLDGGVFTFDGAPFFGSAAGEPLAGPVVAMASTPTGRGYWLLGFDGGIFTYGDAGYFGSTGGLRLAAPIVAMAATPTGRGYWLAGADGGIFTYGDAGYFGSAAVSHPAAPIVAVAATPTGRGYWLVGADGGVFTYGDATYAGSPGGGPLSAPVCSLVPTPSGRGYYLLGQDGAVYTYGDARFFGSYKSLSPDPSLEAGGVDSFYGMSLAVQGGTTGVPAGSAAVVTGYTLYAVAGTTRPPQARQYQLGTVP